MKILIVSAQFPYPPRFGFATRVYQLARLLAKRHEVTLLSYAQPHERAGVTALGEEMTVLAVEYEATSTRAKRAAQALSLFSLRPYHCRKLHSERMQQAIDDLCSREEFDVIQLESSFLCAFRFPSEARLVIDQHNIEYEVFQRMSEGERSMPRRAFNRAEYARCRRFEYRWWDRVAGCAVTSEREVRILRARAPQTPVAAVPNGVDLAYYRPEPGEARPRTVVFNGTLAYRPNLDATQHLIDDIWPLVLRSHPDARLTIVGRVTGVDVRRLRRPGVELVGEVPDIRPYLHAAAVVAAPVRIGGGTRLKVVEGLAMGKAIVSTSLGCEGLAVRDGEHLLIADDGPAFATRVLELFDDPAQRVALGQAGRRLVERNYSWELAGDRLEGLYKTITGTEPARGKAVLSPASTAAGGEA